MHAIFAILTFRTFFIFISTAFALLVVMLALNIITTNDVAQILNLSPNAHNALTQAISRFQEVSKNVIDIISQLLNKVFSWSGVNIDLSKIKIDVNQTDISSGVSK
jgi:hypothetical protein